jgi:hypothetical protein
LTLRDWAGLRFQDLAVPALPVIAPFVGDEIPRASTWLCRPS